MSATFTLQALLNATSGKVPRTAQAFEAAPVVTDSRALQNGCVFLALCGETFDGHQFVTQAFQQGAVAAIINESALSQFPQWADLPNIIEVPNTVEAYLALGSYHRCQMPAKVIGLTGSSGKTTTKEMLFSAFSPITPTQCTLKNHNNEIGVSQTLLAIEPSTHVAIVEMAMRGPGEIGLLARHGKPDVGLIINIGPAHIGRLGSLKAIAQAKCELFEGLNPETGIAVLNGDDALLMETARNLWQGHTLTYHLSQASQITPTAAGGVSFTVEGCPITLQVNGTHMISNALAAITVGKALGYSVEALTQGLEQFVPRDGRMERMPITGHANGWVINDAYNANPQSMQASLAALLQLPLAPQERRVLVLGGMKELGDDTNTYHADLGRWLGKQAGIAALLTVGDECEALVKEAKTLASYPVVHLGNTLPNPDKAGPLLQKTLQELSIPLENTTLFLKGSRSYGLERLTHLFTQPQNAAQRAGS